MSEVFTSIDAKIPCIDCGALVDSTFGSKYEAFIRTIYQPKKVPDFSPLFYCRACYRCKNDHGKWIYADL